MKCYCCTDICCAKLFSSFFITVTFSHFVSCDLSQATNFSTLLLFTSSVIYSQHSDRHKILNMTVCNHTFREYNVTLDLIKILHPLKPAMLHRFLTTVTTKYSTHNITLCSSLARFSNKDIIKGDINLIFILRLCFLLSFAFVFIWFFIACLYICYL